MSDAPAATPGAGGWHQSGSAFAGLTALPSDARSQRNRRLLAVLASRSVLGRRANADRHRRKTKDQNHRSHAMDKSFEDLVGALRKSLQDQANAGAPGMTDAIMKEIDSFEAELAKAVGAIAPPQPDQVNALDRFAAGLAGVQAAIDDIEAGRCLAVAEGLVPSDAAVNLCKTVADLGGVALRAMALDFAAPIGEGEQPTEAETLIKVAGGEGEGEILIKTLLPRDAAEILIVPPARLYEELGAIALELLDEAGITPQQLAKAFPPPKKKAAAAEGEEPEGEGAEEDPEGEEPEGEGEEDPEGEEGDEGDPDPGEGTPLENVAKLAAGILIELDELTQMMPPQQPDSMMAGDPAAAGMDPGADPAAGGGAEEGVMGAVQGMAHLAALIATQADALQAAVDSADDASADQYAEKVAKVAELAKAAALKVPVALQAEGESLQKRASDAEARASNAETALAKAHADLAALTDRVTKLLGEPAPAKGAAMDVTAVTKAADQGVDDDSPIARIEALRKSGQHEQATHELFKVALRVPMPAR